MRCALLLAIVVVGVGAGLSLGAVVPEETAGGPFLLELNAPLLSEPIGELARGVDPPAGEPAIKEKANEQAEASKPDAGTPADGVLPGEADSASKSEEEAASAQTAQEDKAAKKDQAATEPGAEASQADSLAGAAPPARPELTEAMKALRGSVRRTVANYFNEPFNTRDNTPADIMQVCTAFGCEAEIHRGSSGGQRVNAFTCLCYNQPCAGRQPLRICEGQVTAGIGYGLQPYPGQFLAVLGLARVPMEYPLEVGGDKRKVADLVECEKKACRTGEENSFRLIGLARYLPSDATWENELGESWSIARLVTEELGRPAETAPAGGTYRLLALSYAVDRRVKRSEPVDGPFRRAQAYLAKFADYALELQNPDGSWHPSYFAYRGSAGSAVDQLRSTGHILRWLVFSLPEDQLQDPRIVRGVNHLISSLGTQRYRGYVPASSGGEIAARLAAVHALVIYNDRLFVPCDEAEKAKPEPDAAKKTPVAMRPAGRS